MATEKKHPADFTFSDYLIDYCLAIGLSPIWIPMWFGSTISLHCRLFSYLRGPTKSAWQRCAEVWAASENAYGPKIGPNFNTPFEHSLTEYFAHYHPRSRKFLIEQLRNPNPYLAAYAFKCLIRYGPITLDDIPSDVLVRVENITASRFGCHAESMTISNYIRDYFDSTQYLEAESAT